MGADWAEQRQAVIFQIAVSFPLPSSPESASGLQRPLSLWVYLKTQGDTQITKQVVKWSGLSTLDFLGNMVV